MAVCWLHAALSTILPATSRLFPATRPCVRRTGSVPFRGPVCSVAPANDLVRLAEESCSAEPPAFAALREETRALYPGGAHMVSGAQQGRLLHTLVRLSRASRVLEVGSFTGYAALWMALALPAGGSLLSLERDDRAAAVARRHLAAAGVADRTEVRLGDALDSLDALPAHSAPFDLVFLDADKKRYGDYYELLLSRGLLAPDGLLLADNVLWKGQVVDLLLPSTLRARDAAGVDGRTRRGLALRDSLHGFNLRVAADPRTRQLMLPLRDGLTCIQHAPTAGSATAAVDGAAGGGGGEGEGEGEAGGEGARGEEAWKGGYDRALSEYLRRVGSAEPPAFAALREETRALYPGGAHMVSGAQQGRLLHTLVRLSRASRVLEVGSFTGYAALWMALALPAGGSLLSLERDDRAAAVARRHLAAAGVADRAEVTTAGGDGTSDASTGATGGEERGRLDTLLAQIPADASPYDLIVCHCDATQPTPPSDALRRMLDALAAHGTIVLLQPDGDALRRANEREDALRLGNRARVTALPSPDGESAPGLVTLLAHAEESSQ